MGYKILGINLSHNSSVCVLDDGEIIFFLEEERLSRIKHDMTPLHILNFITKTLSLPINEIALSGLNNLINYDPSYQKLIFYLLNEKFPNIPIKDFISNHHLTHAYCSFTNSGFKKALTLIIDGNGSPIVKYNKELWETESIFDFDYKKPPKTLYQSFRIHDIKNNEFDSLVNLTKTYEAINSFLGLGGSLDCGKTMGLSSYGFYDPTIPSLLSNKKGSPTLFNYTREDIGFFNLPPQLLIKNKLQLAKNIAYHIQQETQKAVGDYIEEYLNKTNHTNIVCSGGYFLNCVANYYLTKRFPNVNFYFEPISSDAGTAIGAAKLAWYQKTQDKTIRPQKTLYYGPEYTKEQLLEGIQKYLD